MPFNKELDKELFSESIELDNTKITVSVMSYNEGAPKIQISRENKIGEEYRFSKLGRMSKKEIGEVIPLINKAMEKM